MVDEKAAWPQTGGSGPAPGIIGITDGTSVSALCNYYPARKGLEFIYVRDSRVLLIGRPVRSMFSGSVHQQLAYSIGAVHSYILGGMFRRGPLGEFCTDELSGHFGKNWTDFYRHFFPRSLSEMTGVGARHESWERK